MWWIVAGVGVLGSAVGFGIGYCVAKSRFDFGLIHVRGEYDEDEDGYGPPHADPSR